MTDPIADLLTRIRNAIQVRHDAVAAPYSRMKEAVIQVMVQEGYLKSYEVIGEGIRKQLVVALKYMGRREPVIAGLKRISKPGCRVYRGVKGFKAMGGGVGAIILSTPRGIMTERQAKEANVGGEVLCRIW